MGKKFNCHHGYFELPSEIYEVGVEDNRLTFWCEDGVYQVSAEGQWILRKILEEKHE